MELSRKLSSTYFERKGGCIFADEFQTMVKKIYSITFILAALCIGALAFPLYGGWIEPNMVYGFEGDTPLTDAEWMALNKVYGAGAFAYACILLAYHIGALRVQRKLSTSSYVLRGLLVALISTIPAYIVMLIVQ